jgi:hypothetical protein
MKEYIYIPPSEKTAKKHLDRALAGKLEGLPKRDFMRAYCSVAYLFPGFHPDDWEDWTGPAEIKPLLAEAWRRAEAGELMDNELYPYQATKAAVSQNRKEPPGQDSTEGVARKR